MDCINISITWTNIDLLSFGGFASNLSVIWIKLRVPVYRFLFLFFSFFSCFLFKPDATVGCRWQPFSVRNKCSLVTNLCSAPPGGSDGYHPWRSYRWTGSVHRLCPSPNPTCNLGNKTGKNRVVDVSCGVQGAVSIRKTVLPGMAIPMLKIRRPNGRLIFNMEIAIRR